MDEKTRKVCEEELYNVLVTLEDDPVDSEVWKNKAENARILSDLMIKDQESKSKIEETSRKAELEEKKFEVEQADKKKSLVKESVFKFLDIVLGVANLVGPMLFYSKMWGRHAMFEKEGFIPSSTLFKSFLGKLHPTKKL